MLPRLTLPAATPWVPVVSVIEPVLVTTKLSPELRPHVESTSGVDTVIKPLPSAGGHETANAGVAANEPNAPNAATIRALRVVEGFVVALVVALPLAFAPSEATIKALRDLLHITLCVRFIF